MIFEALIFSIINIEVHQVCEIQIIYSKPPELVYA